MAGKDVVQENTWVWMRGVCGGCRVGKGNKGHIEVKSLSAAKYTEIYILMPLYIFDIANSLYTHLMRPSSM